ncbi:MAG: hypothetical protein ACRCW2_13290 [Cellulosilyticaceae bacterium]
MKKRAKRIMACVLGLLVLTGGGILFWQKENVLAAWEAVRYSEEEIGAQITNSKMQVEDALKTYQLAGIRDFTLEEEEAIRKGELSVADAVARIMAPAQVAALSEAVEEGVDGNIPEAKPSADEVLAKHEADPKPIQTAQADPQAKVDQVVADAVARMYALKGKYLGLLGGVESRAKGAFFALPQSERNIKGLQKIGTPFIKEAMSLESQCNGEVEAVLGQLRTQLKSLDADTAIVGTMQQSYDTEKRLKKAYYLSAFK